MNYFIYFIENIMKRKYLLLLFIFLFYFQRTLYSQNYINCAINLQDTCFIGLYSTKNSHAILCDQIKPLSYGCEIRNGEYRIPINFSSANCTNIPSLFLYKPLNSHVGFTTNYRTDIYPNTIPVCLGNYFRDILEITTSSENAYFLIGLYKYENSHVSTEQDSPIKLYLRILDNIIPSINLNYTENYTILPSTIKISFLDNRYLYYCQIYINNKLYDYSPFCRFLNSYETVFTITSKECPTSPCNLKVVAVDLAGNINVLDHVYTVINPCLQIEAFPLTGGNIMIINFIPYDLEIKIINPRTCYGNFVNLTVRFPGSECNNIILLDGIQERTINISKLNNGELYEIKTRIFPIRSGRCNFIIEVEGYVEGTNIKNTYRKIIPLSVSVRTSIGLLIISEPIYSILVIILLISLFLFL